MRLLISLSSIMFLIIFTISQVVQSREQSARNKNRAFITFSGHSTPSEVEGITSIRQSADGRVELDFDFNCSATNCKSTLYDNDGFASIVTVLSEIQRESICDRSSVMNRNDWNIVKSFLKRRLEHFKNYCQQEVCKNPDLELSSQETRLPVTVMEHCGRVASKINPFLKNIDSYNYNPVNGFKYDAPHELTLLHELVNQTAGFHIYRVSPRPNPQDFIHGENIVNINNSSNIDTRIAKYHRDLLYSGISRQSSLCDGVRQGRFVKLLQLAPLPLPSKPGPVGPLMPKPPLPSRPLPIQQSGGIP